MISLLARPTYSLSEAARLLRLSTSSLRWWLEGGERGGKRYPSVLRAHPVGSTDVSWGEFIEAAYLREYRKYLPLQRLRPLRKALAEELETPFPFAVAQPWVTGRKLVWDMQRKLGLPEELWIVVGSNQLVLGTAASNFFKRVTFDASTREAMRYVVMDAPQPVCVDPQFSFGIPLVRGVRTEVIAELSLAGEPPAVIMDIYRDHGVTAHDIQTAVDFETQFLKAA